MAQTLRQKKGEVNFRKLISKQHIGKNNIFGNEYNEAEILSELKKRIEKSRYDFSVLKAQGFLRGPFLEIGAEYSIRSLILENEQNLHGYALDIASSSLEAVPYFAQKLNFSRLPVRICADAELLPFSDNSFNFVFCYQTLHHFPDPKLVIREVYRILSPGGYFYFSEEPIRQKINLRLFRRTTKLFGFNKILKRLLLLPFISELGKTEVDFGVLEDSLSIVEWEKALIPFAQLTSTLTPIFVDFPQSFKKKSAQHFIKPDVIHLALIALLGGGISTLAKKAGNSSGKITTKFRCPVCKKILYQFSNTFNCVNRHYYKRSNNILYLLPPKLTSTLYPNI